MFQIIAVLLTLSAALAYINHKLLRLPTTIGLMLLALAHALLVVAAGAVFPAARHAAESFMGQIDFDQTLLHGMLGYLLFAGALHVNINDLRDQGWVIATLATLGVLVSTAIVGVSLWLLLPVLGLHMKLIYCLLFGSLIAPTDPIAVLAILTKLGAPKSLETKIAGESLFNDGVGVVLFLALLGFAGLGHETTPAPTPDNPVSAQVHDVADSAAHDAADSHDDPSWQAVTWLFAKETLGGALLGLALGLTAFFMLRSINDYKTEILISLALVTGGYALASYWHLSGPIAMVIAGLLIGNRGRALAMSDVTREHLDTFWELVDEILNAVLFVLIGLEVLVLTLDGRYVLAGLVAIPLGLGARFLAVGGTITVLRRFRAFTPHAAQVMTWAGLRGGISVALALSLKDEVHAAHLGASEHDAAEIILTMTYVVVVFSIVVQGLTIGPLLRRLGLVGGASQKPGHGPS